LTCEAQLLDALGDREQAVRRLQQATTETAVRRNASAFLGWTRQGTPVKALIDELQRRAPTPWGEEIAAAAESRPDVTSVFASGTATVTERSKTPAGLIVPMLSPREREVLRELARGSTYADISANLFVSENTVKTHVSSLYAKLCASRRSEALAIARSMHLL
jgi:LuxR family transcriptional regulator, maltose regulon positive regulatory protein